MEECQVCGFAIVDEACYCDLIEEYAKNAAKIDPVDFFDIAGLPSDSVIGK